MTFKSSLPLSLSLSGSKEAFGDSDGSLKDRIRSVLDDRDQLQGAAGNGNEKPNEQEIPVDTATKATEQSTQAVPEDKPGQGESKVKEDDGDQAKSRI